MRREERKKERNVLSTFAFPVSLFIESEWMLIAGMGSRLSSIHVTVRVPHRRQPKVRYATSSEAKSHFQQARYCMQCWYSWSIIISLNPMLMRLRCWRGEFVWVSRIF